MKAAFLYSKSVVGRLRRLRAYTLVELMMAIAPAIVVIAGVYALSRCGAILTAKCTSMNMTGCTAHNTLDRMQGLLQLAYTPPAPLDSTGAPLSTALSISGTAAVATGLAPVVNGTNATITGTGVGISFFRYVGAPYLVTVGTAGISSSATQIVFTADSSAQVPPPAPKANDYLVIYTTALLSGTFATNNQAWAKLSAITGTSVSGNRATYTASLTPPIVTGTTPGNATASVSYQSNNQGGSVDVSAVLVRPTAFVVVNQTDLRFFDSYVSGAGGSTSVNVNSNFVTLTDLLTLPGTTAPLDQSPTRFSTVTYQGRPFVGVVLHLRAKMYDNFLLKKQSDSFSTYMGVGSLISLKSNP